MHAGDRRTITRTEGRRAAQLTTSAVLSLALVAVASLPAAASVRHDSEQSAERMGLVGRVPAAAGQARALEKPAPTVLRVSAGPDTNSRHQQQLVEDVLESVGGGLRVNDRATDTISVAVPADEAREAVEAMAALPGVEDVEELTPMTLHKTPDDPKYSRQRESLQAINLPRAWNRATGSRDVTVAVIDSGIDRDHRDLRGKVVKGTDAVYPGSYHEDDRSGHGTAVAGVAASGTNNNVGIAGVGWSSRLLVAKVDDNNGYIYSDAVARGVRWAANQDADVINLSLGSPYRDDQLRKAVAYAQRQGSVVVASAGNDGDTTKNYPAAYPGVIAVGATAGDHKAGFSTYGDWVEVAAPGSGLHTTFAGGRYGEFSGTSASAPVVAGQAALLRGRKPGASVETIRSIIMTATSDVAAKRFANGRINVFESIKYVTGAKPTAPRDVAAIGGDGSVTVSWRAPESTYGASVRRYFVDSRKDGGPWVRAASKKGGKRQATLRGFAAGDVVDVRVKAKTRFGVSRRGGPATAVVGPWATASAPLAVSAHGYETRARITWETPASTSGLPVTDYVVQRSDDLGSPWVTVRTVPGDGGTHKFTEIREVGDWRYRVAAVTQAGVGEWSTPVLAAVTGDISDLEAEAAQLAAGTRLGWIQDADDSDMFRIELSPGQTLDVRIDRLDGDFDLRAFSSALGSAESTAGGTSADAVTLANDTAVPQLVFVDVYGFSGSGSYRMTTTLR
jgi:subtilisin family serine protease